METQVRLKTVQLIGKLLQPLATEGLLSIAEHREIIANLRHLASKGTMLPVVIPRLVSQEEAATTLGIGLSNFKKLERAGMLPGIRRKMVGSSVRYRSTEIASFLLADDDVPLTAISDDEAL
jgi:hypothetical protein